MSVELGAALLAVLSTAGMWFIADRLLTPSAAPDAGTDTFELTIGPFVLSFVSYMATLLVAIVLLGVMHNPTEQGRDSFSEFFSSSAQVLAGLLVAFAVVLHERGRERITSEAPSDVLQFLVCVVLGLASSLAALLPDITDTIFSAALIVVPASVVGALVAITALAFQRPSR